MKVTARPGTQCLPIPQQGLFPLNPVASTFCYCGYRRKFSQGDGPEKREITFRKAVFSENVHDHCCQRRNNCLVIFLLESFIIRWSRGSQCSRDCESEPPAFKGLMRKNVFSKGEERIHRQGTPGPSDYEEMFSWNLCLGLSWVLLSFTRKAAVLARLLSRRPFKNNSHALGRKQISDVFSTT